MKRRILICEEIAQEVKEFILQSNIDIKYGSSTNEENVIREISDCDAVLVRTLKITRDIIEHAPKLKVIAKHGVGCDSIDCVAAKEYGIPIVYTPGANAQSVAEHTISLMLACARSLRKANIEYEKGNYYVKNQLDIQEISGKKLGLVGCGNIAQKVAKIAKFGFDMDVMAYDKYNPQFPDYISKYEKLEDLLAISDIVSVHIPGGEKNKNLFNYELFSLMKNSAIFINTARGDIVNTTDLIFALENNQIYAAGLDVTEPEPIKCDSQLFKNPNIIVSPHIGATSKEAMIRMGMECIKGVNDVFDGVRPRNLYEE